MTRHRIFFKRSCALPDTLRSCIFHIHFMEHLILEPLSSQGLWECSFLHCSSAAALVVRKVVFAMAAFGTLLQCLPPQRLFLALYLDLNSWPVLLPNYLIPVTDNVFVPRELRRITIKSGFYAPQLPFICIYNTVFYALLNETQVMHFYACMDTLAEIWIQCQDVPSVVDFSDSCC